MKIAALVRDFVHTAAFDQLILSAIAVSVRNGIRNRGVR